MPHALRRFVQQHQLRVHRQRGGDLEGALAAVRQFDRDHMGERTELDPVQQLHGPCIEHRQTRLSLPEMERRRQRALQADAHVFEHGQVGKHCGHLERADDAAARDLRWLFQGDVLAAVDDLAAGGNQELGEQVEEGRLAGAIGADQRVDLSTAHPQVDVAHGDEATELLGQVARFEDETVSCAVRRGCHSGFPTRFSCRAAACGDGAGPWFRPSVYRNDF